MKMFGFIKQVFFTGLTILSTLSNVNPLKCISMNNQEYKVRPEIINVNSDEPVLILLILKQVNSVVVVTISMIPVQNCVFLMLQKT